MTSFVSASLAADRRPIQNSAVIVPRANSPSTSRPAPSSPASSVQDSISDECSVLDLDLSARQSRTSISNLTCATSVLSLSSSCVSPTSQNSRQRGSVSSTSSTVARITLQTPPESSLLTDRLATATHVLSTEAAALAAVTQLYTHHASARTAFNAAVSSIVRLSLINGKLVIIGVGKSGIIGRKLVATFSSLGICAVFLHPTEALHGDLGVIQPNDTLLVITFSGKTPELLLLEEHLPPSLPTILLTAHIRPDDCAFIRARQGTILLPTPIPTPEKSAFGVSAPTSSTTTALAVGDALAMTVAQELASSRPGGLASVFAANHPGGAIGQAFRAPASLSDLVTTPFSELPLLEPRAGSEGALTCADVLRAGFEAANGLSGSGGWLRLCDGLVLPPSRIKRLRNDQLGFPLEKVPGLVVGREGMLGISGQTQVRVAQELVRSANAIDAGEGKEFVRGGDVVVAVLDAEGQIVGVLEASQVLSQS